MSESRTGLRRLVEEGALAARQPPLASLRRRARRRRTTRGVTIAAAVVAAAAAAFPLAGHERPRPAPTPAATTAPRLSAEPSRTTSGGVLTISGAGCTPGQAVSLGLRWDRGAPLSLTMTERKKQPRAPTSATAAGRLGLVTVTALGSGAFTARLTIPATFMVRISTLWARCPAAGTASPLTQEVPLEIRNP